MADRCLEKFLREGRERGREGGRERVNMFLLKEQFKYMQKYVYTIGTH